MSATAPAAALGSFAARYPFGLDPFQVEACRALEAGSGVLVAAPTGAGKTVVGEFAVHLALATGRKCFYTTPIKALSNQKYGDLLTRHGPADVGLLTGDNSINGDASVVVMTTEVLRNMLYAGSPALAGLGYVVMDEVHYLSDRYRGAVWEEVIIHLPAAVRVVSLSATVSNAEEFAEWLVTVRGDTEVVVEETRPVPLWQHVLAGHRLYDLFAESPDGHPSVNSELLRLAREEQRFSTDWDDRRRRDGRRRSRGATTPSRSEVVERLDREGLLPAIVFIFSRAGCDAAVGQCLRAGLRLNTPDEAERVRAYVELRCADLPDEDLGILRYAEWLDGLERGLAAHHAGLIPTFKECVEELFVRGLVKAVFATETLALGINMPARSVVLERLVKWNGETHADITPGEYTQLTGRAGRRGIDVEGHAVVVWQPGLDPRSLAGLASTRTYPLRSSFRPSYNMAVNLVGSVGRERARALLESSFAQFQADRSVVGLARQVAANTEALAGYTAAMACELGDFTQYAALRRALRERESAGSRAAAAQRRAAAVESLFRLRPGDVVRVPAGKRAGLAVVLDPGVTAAADPKPVVLTADRQVRRLSLDAFPTAVETLGRVRIPRNFNGRSPQDRRDLASSLRAMPADGGRRTRSTTIGNDPEITRLRRAIREHPCHGCPDRDDHARWAERWARLERDTRSLQSRVRGKTSSVATTFDRVCRVLDRLGYLDGDRVTESGGALARVYNESDLLVVECLRRGVWDALSPPELAGCLAALVYESRGPVPEAAPRLPGGSVPGALAEMVSVWGELEEAEQRERLDFVRAPDAGLVWAAYRWASGAPLGAVLREGEMTPGDFVRWMKLLLDLLGQLGSVAAPRSPVRPAAEAAVTAVRRGVVAYSSLV